MKILPSVIGLTREIFNSYGGQNYVKTITDSTLYIKNINVKDSSINKTYAVGWAERSNAATTTVHAGWKADGSALHKSISKNFDYYSSNYNNDTYLKNKAINVYKNNMQGEKYFKEYYTIVEKVL